MDIIERFLEALHKYPNEVAVYDGEYQYTYKDFAELIAGYANVFQHNQGDELRVAISGPQSVDAYASMYATLICGGYYCPINYDLPYARKAKICAEFSPTVFICFDETEKDIASSATKVVLPKYIERHPISIISNRSRHDLAYVIFTSGSTGTPKGVVIRREAVSKFIDWAVEEIKPTLGDRWAQFSNIGFDLSVMDVFAALGSGACLVPINNQRHRLDPSRAIKKYNLTVWHSVPSVIDLLDRLGQITPDNLKSIRLMSFCGERLWPHQVKKLFAANPEMIILNTYGPTEGTVFCTYLSLQKDMVDLHSDTTVAVGKPIPGWQIALVGGHDRFEGEIVIYGNYLGKGYWQDKQRSDEVFRNINIDNQEYPAFFSGDWAEIKNDNLYFRNRIDRQVKVHGFRVELEEIESVIRNYGITNCRVVYDSGKLYAFLEKSTTINLEQLKQHLRSSLPHYEMPSEYILLDDLPRNHNDKTDISLLKKMIKGNLDGKQSEVQ